jgi:uncharacterized protein (DUF1778 family)
VPHEIQEVIEQAADVVGATLNQFVVQAALNEAHRVIERERVINMTLDDAAFLLNLLEAPPEPNERLKLAIQRHGAMVRNADSATSQTKPSSRRIHVRKRRPG